MMGTIFDSWKMLQIVVFQLAVLIGLAGHFSQVETIRALGWILMVVFIAMGIAQGAGFTG